MHELAVIAFKGTAAADEALHRLRNLAGAHRIGLDDACVAVRDAGGALHLKQAITGPAADLLPRHFWREVVDHILHHGRTGALERSGSLDHHFVREVAGALDPGTSALFVVAELGSAATLGEAMKGQDARLLQAVLPEGERAALMAALDPPAEHVPTAEDLRAFTAQEERVAEHRHTAEREAKDAARLALVRHLREAPLTDRDVRALVVRFKEAARLGETRTVAYRFPSDVCTDGGRAINSLDPDWPNSLQGQPRALYDYWNATLRAKGYRLSAEILNFPGGMPGDVGFIFDWSAPGADGR